MKIPFDLTAWLKDKSQKVVTRDGRPVEILKTNMPGELPLLVLYDGNDVERVSTDGKYQIDYDGMNDLFLVTEDEPELTEFEKTVSDLCWRVGMGEAVKDASQIKREADKLFSIAHKQIEAEKKRTPSPALTKIVENLTPEKLEKTKKEMMEETEDERIRKSIVEGFKNYNESFKSFGGIEVPDILAWLEKQKEQKPAGWSEEDEEMLNIALQCLVGTPYSQGTKDKVFHWLKSLKNRGNFPKSNTNSPSWKPSEGQMKALKEAVDMHWEPDGLDPLYSLYEHLKKLI